jgi:hypothetical protein
MAFGERLVRVPGYVMTVRHRGDYAAFSIREMVETAFEELRAMIVPIAAMPAL